MILTWLKHTIFEICIDKFFSEVQKNFPMLVRDISFFSIGDYVEVQIVMGDAHKIFNKCKVVYKDGKDMIIEAYDTDVPLKLIMEDGILKNISFDDKEYGEFFDEKG